MHGVKSLSGVRTISDRSTTTATGGICIGRDRCPHDLWPPTAAAKERSIERKKKKKKRLAKNA